VTSLQEVLDQDAGYSEAEKEAMIVVEELRLVNGLDLAAVLLRVKFVRLIQQRNMVANHPGGYQSLQELARAQGISMTELSHDLDLVGVIFPYIQDTLGIPVAQLWEQMGRSNFKELIPVVKSIITGEPSPTASVQQAAERILDDVAATARSAGMEMDDEGMRREAIAQLLNDGTHLTNRELRTHIRPTRTPNINASLLTVNGRKVLIADMDEDQWTMFQRNGGSRFDIVGIEPPGGGEIHSLDELAALLVTGMRDIVAGL